MHDDRPLPLIDADHRRLVRAATRLLGPADAEDAVQDAYVRALEASPGGLNAAQAWLLTVMRHLAIDRLRRRQWLQQWVAEANAVDAAPAAPSAEGEAALAEAVAGALRRLARHLSPVDGAAVLLHEVFEASHAELSAASGKTEAGSRQQLRRALQRLRRAGDAPEPTPHPEREPGEEAAFHLYLQSLRWRDPQALWALLRQPPVQARASSRGARSAAAPSPGVTTSSIVQVGGQLGLLLALDGVTLCVVPLGTTCQREREASSA